ncbi:MAG: hypothetical protein AAB413_04150 [Patescibacteria group bacterium]
MSLTERPKWRMTRCEAQVILDLEALNRALRAPERWVPEPLITLLMSARKGGRPHVTLRTLKKQGYVEYDPTQLAWRRTGKPVPRPEVLSGDAPNPIPQDAMSRLATAWRRGRRSFTLEDLAATPPDLKGVPKSSPKRGRA